MKSKRLKRCLLWLCLIIALITAALALIWPYIPEVFYAYEWVRVSRGAHRAAQPEIILSDTVLEAALRRPGIAELSCLKDEKDKVAWLRENLKVNYLGGSEILQIKMSGTNREEVWRIVHAVRAAYMDHMAEMEQDMEIRRHMKLERADRNIYDKMPRFRENWWRLSRLESLADDSLRGYLEELENRITELRAEITELDGRIETLDQQREIEIADIEREARQFQLEAHTEVREMFAGLMRDTDNPEIRLAMLKDIWDIRRQVRKRFFELDETRTSLAVQEINEPSDDWSTPYQRKMRWLRGE